MPVSDETKNIRRNRAFATHELWFSVKTVPFEAVFVKIQKLIPFHVTQVARPKVEYSGGMLKNDHLTVTFNDQGLESINGVKITNQIQYFNSSQGYGQNSGAYVFRSGVSLDI